MLTKLELKVIPVIQLLLALAWAWGIKRLLPSFNYTIPFSLWITLALIALALYIGIKAIKDFRKHDTTVNPSKPENSSSLVNTGIFSLSRNPMYLAMLLALFSGCVFLQNFASLSSCVLFFLSLTRLQILPEERVLLRSFGEDYKRYMANVRRWL